MDKLRQLKDQADIDMEKMALMIRKERRQALNGYEGSPSGLLQGAVIAGRALGSAE